MDKIKQALIDEETKAFFEKMEIEVAKAKKIIEESRKPQTGIYWIYKDKFIDVLTQDWDEPLDNSRMLHINRWEILKKHGFLDIIPLYDRKDDYTSIPRGRVEWSKTRDKFIIWHGKDFTAKHRAMIVKEYYLPPDKTIDEQQEHYEK